MVVREINEVKDTSLKITISVWMDEQPPGTDPAKDHHDFDIAVGDGWVCIGGGATGVATPFTGNFLTASFPLDDWKTWKVRTRDHIVPHHTKITGYAIGMKVNGLSRDELITSLSHADPITSDDSFLPDSSCPVKDGFVLLGGGFEVLGAMEGGGNMATGSFPDSTLSWRARSKDEYITTKTKIKVYAIGINPKISLPDPIPTDANHRKDWNVVTSFASSENMNWTSSPSSSARPLKGYALCGGGADVHYTVNDLLWALEPTTLASPIPPDGSIPPPVIVDPALQTFTGKADAHLWRVAEWNPGLETHYASGTGNTLTAYAMGIKLVDPAAPGPSGSCDKQIKITEARSSGNLNPQLPEYYVYDGKLDTKWISTNIPKPWISVLLEGQKPICRVEIAWAEGNIRKYKFYIEVSPDATGDQNWGTPVFTGQSAGITGFEPYSVTAPATKRMKITITESSPGPVPIQISEIKVFSNV